MTGNPHPPAVAPQPAPPLLSPDEADFPVPGVQVVYDPDAAEAAGAFMEDALSEAEAWASNTADDREA